MNKAYYDRLTAISGKHGDNINYSLLLNAYSNLRAYGLGHFIFMIDQSPEVLNSLRRCSIVLRWLKNQFRFRDKVETGLKNLTHSWHTNADVRFYGSEDKPIRTRQKILNERGELKYDSILMKMFLRRIYMDEIRDYIGVELIVKDEDERKKLVKYFSKVKGTGVLESFKGPDDVKKRSTSSSSGFDVTKFIIRPPIIITDHYFRQLYTVPLQIDSEINTQSHFK